MTNRNSIEEYQPLSIQANDFSRRIININSNQNKKYVKNEISTTKYGILSFLPKFLFEQFQKFSNVFFLFIALMQQIPDVSPTGRFTTAIPFIMILSVSAVKEILEDLKRHHSDIEVNKAKVAVLKNGNWCNINWSKLEVGNSVQISRDQKFPADIILLSSSEPSGICYVETSNLDGETNLKLRKSCAQTSGISSINELSKLSGHIDCELPNKKLYSFSGNLVLNHQETIPIGPEHILLRGSKLLNTGWIFGIVVYTGKESKLILNSSAAPIKRTSVEKTVNSLILILFVILFILSLVSTLASEIWTLNKYKGHWYLEKESPKFAFLYDLLTFVILYNNLIPISLPVTIEMVKWMQAKFIGWDLDMYYEETNTAAEARTSNLNEELGKVEYIFCDKTGTLTQNIMEFKRCTIGSISYGGINLDDSFDVTDLEIALQKNDDQSKLINDFFILLAICHSVMIEENPADKAQINYQASSPDERALILGANKLGYIFYKRISNTIYIKARGKELVYKEIEMLDFTSDRKRMSMIVETNDGTIQLLIKGADSVILKRLKSENSFTKIVKKNLDKYAEIGLRTLCIATKKIEKTDFENWHKQYKEAKIATHNKEKMLADAENVIEKDLSLLGVTAIEDKLQEGVPETIEHLANANIKLWVLTGDKQETAINIGYSCRLFTGCMRIETLNEKSEDSILKRIRDRMKFLSDSNLFLNTGLVIDGDSLMHALSETCRQEFILLAVKCRAVICCRVSPSQKADIVQFVRDRMKVITLAIGDGANDVGMIQKAHVGVGISGQEGLQAACASDYSIAQFRYLEKLILVHGAWSYHRLTKLILYSFYKNICLYFIEFWYAFLSGFSGQIIFERWTIGLYNVLFTAAPPFVIGIFDKFFESKERLNNPDLYKHSQKSKLFNIKIFLIWSINAIYHSFLIFWMSVWAFKQDIAFKDGKIGNYLFLGNMIYTYVVVTVSLKAGFEMTNWTMLSHLSIWGSILSWFVFLCVYSQIWPTFNIASVMVGMEKYIFTCSIFWICLILIPTTCLITEIAFKVFQKDLRRNIRVQSDLEDESHKSFQDDLLSKVQPDLNDEHYKKRFSRSHSFNKIPELRRGFAFSIDENSPL